MAMITRTGRRPAIRILLACRRSTRWASAIYLRTGQALPADSGPRRQPRQRRGPGSATAPSGAVRSTKGTGKDGQDCALMALTETALD